MRTKLTFYLFGVVFLFSHATIAQTASLGKVPVVEYEALPVDLPESVGMSSARLQKMEQRMHQYVDDGKLSGVQTAVIRKGKLVQFDTYGYADIESKSPLKENSIFRIYSMTKPIVSVALMMLYEEGKFQLNDPLAKYIPEVENMNVYTKEEGIKPAKNKIRVIDILRHTSGFGYGWGRGHVDSLYRSINRRELKDNATFVKRLSELPLYSEPGTAWKYSLSTDVCGHLVEVLSGQPLDQFLRERILDPLGMKDTHFEVPDDKDSRFITNYAPGRDGTLRVIDHPSKSRYCEEVTMFSGGGGMVSTAMDYLVFSQMLLNGGELRGVRILSPKTIELMTGDHTKHLPDNGNGTGFGLGFSVTKDLSGTKITGSEGAYGWGGAAGTFFRIDPQEEMVYLLEIIIKKFRSRAHTYTCARTRQIIKKSQ